jgi:hypothetical protein
MARSSRMQTRLRGRQQRSPGTASCSWSRGHAGGLHRCSEHGAEALSSAAAPPPPAGRVLGSEKAPTCSGAALTERLGDASRQREQQQLTATKGLAPERELSCLGLVGAVVCCASGVKNETLLLDSLVFLVLLRLLLCSASSLTFCTVFESIQAGVSFR